MKIYVVWDRYNEYVITAFTSKEKAFEFVKDSDWLVDEVELQTDETAHFNQPKC